MPTTETAMTSSYFAPLAVLPDLITEPGQYRTRCGEIAVVTAVSDRHDFGCKGHYAFEGEAVTEGWHKSGRIYGTFACDNDIVAKA
jgi:hypothetical protein